LKKTYNRSRRSVQQEQCRLETEYRRVEKKIIYHEEELIQLRRRRFELELEIANYENNSL
jgi:hypothetical protein